MPSQRTTYARTGIEVSSEDPLLHKMDALLKRHRGETKNPPPAPETPPSAAPGWLPVLTQVIERGSPPEEPASLPPDTAVSAIGPGPVLSPDAGRPGDEDALVDRLMQALAPRLTEIVEQRIAAELHRNLDQTLAALLAQLDVHVREIVRDTLTDTLKPPRE